METRLAFTLIIALSCRKEGLQASSFGNETTSSDVAAPKSRSELASRGAAALIGADLAGLVPLVRFSNSQPRVALQRLVYASL